MTRPIGLDRRRVLFGAAPAAALTTAAVASCAPRSGQAPAHDPLFFTAPEWAFVKAAVDRLIPADELGPGGLESGVAVFIDRQLDGPWGHGAYFYMQGPFQPDASPQLGYQLKYDPRDLYRGGIAGADQASRDARGEIFADLDPAQQDAFLTALQAGKVTLKGPPSQAFFAQLLENTREGFFADPIYGGNRGMAGWRLIGFPGARADFTDWIDQAGVAYPYGPVGINGTRG